LRVIAAINGEENGRGNTIKQRGEVRAYLRFCIRWSDRHPLVQDVDVRVFLIPELLQERADDRVCLVLDTGRAIKLVIRVVCHYRFTSKGKERKRLKFRSP